METGGQWGVFGLEGCLGREGGSSSSSDSGEWWGRMLSADMGGGWKVVLNSPSSGWVCAHPPLRERYGKPTHPATHPPTSASGSAQGIGVQTQGRLLTTKGGLS